jgi:hypothetical protein
MRGSSILKTLNIVFETWRVGVNSKRLHSLAEEVGIVDTLGAGKDLFTAHEEIYTC